METWLMLPALRDASESCTLTDARKVDGGRFQNFSSDARFSFFLAVGNLSKQDYLTKKYNLAAKHKKLKTVLKKL